MYDINITQISVTIPIQLGRITEKMKTRLHEVLSKEVGFINIGEGSVGIVFLPQNNQENLVINSDRITYTKLGNNFDNKRFVKIFTILLDILMLDSNSKFVIDLRGLIKTDNSHTSSLERFKENYSSTLENYKQVYGIGYRFLIDDADSKGEFKIEPLIQDKQFYFLQNIIDSKNVLNIENIGSKVNDNINNFKGGYTDLINKIIR
jgi:hypothetical protein